MNTAPKRVEIEELPEGWIEVNLKAAVESMKNGLYKPATKYAEEGVACLRMYNIDGGRIVWKNIKRMLLTSDEVSEYQLAPDDLLVNRVNSRELVGKTAVFPKGLEPCVYESKNIRVRLLSELVNSDFVNYQLLLFGQHHFNYNSQQVVGMASISQPQIGDFPLLVPPRIEQDRIASKVRATLAKVEKSSSHIANVAKTLKRFRQAVLAAACSGKLTEDWRSSTLQEIAPVTNPDTVSGLFDEGDLPELPEKWVWTNIGALAAPEKNSITDGPFGSNLKTEHYTTTGPRVIRLQNIGDYRFVDVETHVSTQHFGTLTKHQIRAGDVAIACLGDPVPRACLIPESVGPAIVKADCVRLKPNPEIANRHYVCYVLNDTSTRARMSEIVHGVGRARLNLQQIKSIPVPLPPMAEQLEAVRRAEAMFCLADEIDGRIALAATRSDKLTQSILAKAFRGELVPTEAELARREGREYEPASVLLERIKREREGQLPVNRKRRPMRPRAQLATAKG